MSRVYELRIKLTKEELQKIKTKAEKVSMPTSAFVRFIALNSAIKPTVEE